MVIDLVGDYVCRKAEAGDLASMYVLLEPLVCDSTQTPSLYAVEQRRLRKNLKFFVGRYDAYVVEKNGAIVAAYVGKGNAITHIGTSEVDPIAAAVLMHNVLNCVHNKFTVSEFKILNDSYRKTFTSKVFGDEATAIDKFGHGIIPLETKQKIEYLYSILKR